MNKKIVTDYLDESADKYPDKIAFTDEKREISFKSVRHEARKVAMSLAKEGIFKKPVVIFMDKCVECINSFVGVTYSGNFYTVIDIHMPLPRIKKIMDTLCPEAIITNQTLYAESEKIANGIKIFTYEDMMQNTEDNDRLNDIREKIIETDVLYVLFTSGSTGTPKGVIIPHKAVIAYLEWGAETFNLDSNTIFGNQTPFYFVMSGFDIYQTIRNGCTMHIIPKSLFSFPVKLLEFMQAKEINTIFWVPSVLCLVANFRALPEIHLSKLKTVMFGGEVMPTKQLNMWRKEYPDVQFINQYGPTEMTDICAYYLVERELEDTESLPIGKPSNHMEIMLLGEDDQPVAYGEVGEICGRGPSLAYGYYNDAERTAEVFVQNPVNKSYPELIYRTGDLARYNDRGELIYISRKDFQIKHMGNRIELGEIETAVSALEGIEMNCCIYDNVKSKIVLFYVGNIESEEVLKRLKLLLPEYMLPNKRVKLEKMPMNLNGKIDRAQLKERL